MSMLVTLEKMKAYLGIPALTTTDDAFLTSQIEYISEAIETYCVRRFSLGNYVETFYRNEWLEQNNEVRKNLILYAFPVVTVSEVRQFISEDDATGEVIANPRIHYPTGSIRRRSSDRATGFFQEDLFNTAEIIRVTYSAGFSVIPEVIQQTVMELVEARYNRKKSGVSLNFGSDVQSISIPGVLNLQFDYSLINNDRKTAFGTILGNHLNVIDLYRSERAINHGSRLEYYSVT